jgi:ABC-type transport system involved in multi-copper enzyme maturation permease subunit
MKWLLWKEYRLNLVILIVGVVLLVTPHAVALAVTWYGTGPIFGGGAPQLSVNLFLSGIYSLVLTQLTLALLGGHAIACERVDRSAEFLAYLPLSRARILAGKITLALLTAALIWVPNLLILQVTVAELPELPITQGNGMPWTWLGGIAITGLVLFSVGWLLSSALVSPTFAICGGLGTPLLILLGAQTLALVLGYPLEVVGPWYRRTCLVLAPACFLAGTWYYLRRVEP